MDYELIINHLLSSKPLTNLVGIRNHQIIADLELEARPKTKKYLGTSRLTELFNDVPSTPARLLIYFYELPSNSAIPTNTELAAELQTSEGTIRNAKSVLKKTGYIYSKSIREGHHTSKTLILGKDMVRMFRTKEALGELLGLYTEVQLQKLAKDDSKKLIQLIVDTKAMSIY